MRTVRQLNGPGGRPIVIFGGTFDPVHYGHLRAAWEARELLGAEEVRFVPAGEPPHRSEPVTDAAHRLAMLKLGIGQDAGFSIDDREIRRPGPSYMVDTLAELREECGSSPLVLLIGQDSANALDHWHRWEDIFSFAHLAIMSRAGDIQRYSKSLAEMLRERSVDSPGDLSGEPGGRVLGIHVASLAISSSSIRSIVGDGRSPRYLMPAAALDYISAQGLYAEECASRG